MFGYVETKILGLSNAYASVLKNETFVVRNDFDKCECEMTDGT